MLPYKNKVRFLLSMEGADKQRYLQAATRAGMNLNEWIVAQCERTCKRDARKINNRNNKGE